MMAVSELETQSVGKIKSVSSPVSLSDPSTGSSVAVGAMSSSLSDSNSSERACGGWSLRFFGVAPLLL
jgi:hypothetical protein